MRRSAPVLSLGLLVLGAGAFRPLCAQAPAVADIQVAPPSVSLAAGQRTSVFATAYDAKNAVVVIQRITWVSSNPAIVRVEADSTSPEIANLVGVAGGSAIVEARIGNRRGVATVTVTGGGAPAPAPVAAARPANPPPPVVVSTGNVALIKLEPSSLFLLLSEGRKLLPVFLREDGTPATPLNLTWKSLVPTIATVDAEGGVVALSPGQGLIEATAGNLAARIPVQVTLSNIAVARRSATMSPGMMDTFTVIVPDQQNRVLSPNSFQWRSSDESVARVSPFGVVTAVGGGRVEIIASGFLQEIRLPVNVHKQVEYLKLSPPARGDTIRIPLGSTVRFTAEPQALDNTTVAEAPVSWRLLDTSVVGFDQNTGVMSPKRVGTTRLRVSAGSGLDTAWTVSVIAGGVRIGTHLVGLATGDRLHVSASLVDDSGNPIAPATGLRWISTAPAVAQVDAEGNVTAAGFGRASIIATTPWARSDTLVVMVQGELLITSTRGGTADIYALDRRAPTAVNRLTNLPSTEVAASFAHGGTSIAFISSKDGNQEIYTVDADGTNLRRLTNTPAQEDSPEWTPDGKQIVYASNAAGSYQIWIMNADGTEQKKLTDGPAFNFQPSVAPDGKSIAFTSTRESNYDVYLMNLDGTSQRNGHKSPGKETIPQFMPDGQLAFLQEQRNGTGRNAPLTSVVVRRDAAGALTNLTPLSIVVTDFAVSPSGDLLALIISSSGQGGSMSSRLALLPTSSPGGTPTDVPLSIPTEQVFSPSFRR